VNEIFICQAQIHPIKVVLNGSLVSTNEFENLNFENAHTYNQGYEKRGLCVTQSFTLFYSFLQLRYAVKNGNILNKLDMAEEKKRSTHTQMYEAAKAGQIDEVKELFARGGSVNMAVMGAADGKQKVVGTWALENGACPLFSFTQPPRKSEGKFIPQFTTRHTMLGGPGEVQRGTFKKTEQKS